MEWQANALAPRIQMPMGMFKTQASKYIKEYRDMLGKDDIIDVIEPVIDELAAFFCVSRLAAKIRMVDAGYEEAICSKYMISMNRRFCSNLFLVQIT